jgi:Delta14-sterol reductase
MASEKSKKQLSQASLNPRTTEYEFLGPPGALFVTLSCPLIVFALIFLCNENGCPPRHMSTWKSQFPTSFRDFVDWKAIKWYFSFQVALALLWLVLPGKWARGRPLRDGTILEYKCNGTLIAQKGS